MTKIHLNENSKYYSFKLIVRWNALQIIRGLRMIEIDCVWDLKAIWFLYIRSFNFLFFLSFSTDKFGKIHWNCEELQFWTMKSDTIKLVALIGGNFSKNDSDWPYKVIRIIVISFLNVLMHLNVNVNNFKIITVRKKLQLFLIFLNQVLFKHVN